MGRLGKPIPGWERAFRLIDCLTQRTESQGVQRTVMGDSQRSSRSCHSDRRLRAVFLSSLLLLLLIYLAAPGLRYSTQDLSCGMQVLDS